MSSKVTICNIALARLGANRITSLTDNTNEAKLCSLLFETTAEEVIKQGEWPCAIKRATLARLTTAPVFEYTYKYQLPVSPKCLKVLNLEDDLFDKKYVVESGTILTDESSVKIRYLAYLEDTDEWDIYLRDTFIVKFMSYLSYSIVGDAGLTAKLEEMYMQKLQDNIAESNKQGSKIEFLTDDLTRIR